jgi:hypothetical protein
LVRIEREIVSSYPDGIVLRMQHRPQKTARAHVTNLHNQRSRLPIDIHRDLDAAVAAAFGWPEVSPPPSIVQFEVC